MQYPESDSPTRLSKLRAQTHHIAHRLIHIPPEPGRAKEAAEWVLEVAVGLIGVSLILGPDKGPLALLGAMAVNSVHRTTMRARIKYLIGIGAATLACEAIGILTAPYTWAIPLVLAAATLVSLWLWHSLLIGPPGPVNIIFAGALGTFMGAEGWTIGQLLPINALGWLLSFLAALAVLALDPHSLDRQVVDSAELAVATYRDLPAQTSSAHRAHTLAKAWNSVDTAWQTLRTGRTPGTVPLTAAGRQVEQRLREIHMSLVVSLHQEAFPAEPLDISDHFDLTPMGRPSSRYLLRNGCLRGARPRLIARRASLAVLLAGLVSLLLPIGHPYWAMLAALIILIMGSNRANLTIRSAHRVAGTSLGALCYFLIVLTQPNDWARIFIILAAIYGMELMVRRNYAVAVIFVTIFALMLTPASAEQAQILLTDRVLETLIGVGAALLATWFIGRSAPTLLVRRQYRLCLEAIATALQDIAAGLDDGVEAAAAHQQSTSGKPTHLQPQQLRVREHRRDLVFELGRAGFILADVQPDAPDALADWHHLQREISLFGYDVVACAWRRTASTAQAAQEAAATLTELIAGLPPISAHPIDPEALATKIAATHTQFLR